MRHVLRLFVGATLCIAANACASVKDKTAPCRRPADLTALVEEPRRECGPMRAVNDPEHAFAMIGLIEGVQ